MGHILCLTYSKQEKILGFAVVIKKTISRQLNLLIANIWGKISLYSWEGPEQNEGTGNLLDLWEE